MPGPAGPAGPAGPQAAKATAPATAAAPRAAFLTNSLRVESPCFSSSAFMVITPCFGELGRFPEWNPSGIAPSKTKRQCQPGNVDRLASAAMTMMRDVFARGTPVFRSTGLRSQRQGSRGRVNASTSPCPLGRWMEGGGWPARRVTLDQRSGGTEVRNPTCSAK